MSSTFVSGSGFAFVSPSIISTTTPNFSAYFLIRELWSFAKAFVGYTNAGKSTLFNYLTDANVKVEDQLFATLDPTLRRINTDNGNDIILTDTVGFIRDLPHELIESFKATLDEVKEADLLIHIIDVDQEQRQQRIDEVNQVSSTSFSASKPLGLQQLIL